MVQAVPAQPTPQDRREFVQTSIDFLSSSAGYYGDPNVRVTPALFERVVNAWYVIVVDRERMIDRQLGRDVLLKRNLHAAYIAAIRVLMRRAAAAFHRSEADLYRENTGRIPMWAWQTPHHSALGFSTPLPQGRSPDILTGNVDFASSGFAVSILPDGADPALGNRAETRLGINRQLPAAQWRQQGARRIVTGFNAPPPPTATIQTFYGPGVTATSRSAYGRGTTPQDVAGGRVTPRSTKVGFHEGSHGLAFVDFLEHNPAPVFAGRVGMTVGQFLAARTAWSNALRAYHRRAMASSTALGDCVGTTIDQYNQAHGVVAQAVCGP